MFHTIKPLVLASASPRRRELLESIGLEFHIETAQVDESPAGGESPSDFVLRLSKEKAEAVTHRYPGLWVLAADTIVVVDGDILGKPENMAAASNMLQRLSGRVHEVWTGFCLRHHENSVLAQKAVRTEVRFADLSDALCDAYVKTGEPLDKAGAYGIQGKGACLVEAVNGSYTNVVGLPLAEVVQDLLKHGIIAPRVA